MCLRRFFLLIVLPFTLFNSCEKDEPNVTFTGTWLLQSQQKTSCTDASKNSGRKSGFIFNTPCKSEARLLCTYEQYVFTETTYSRNASNSVFAIPISVSKDGTYTLSGSTLTVCETLRSGESDCTVFECSINGNGMSLAKKNPDTGCLEINYYLKQES